MFSVFFRLKPLDVEFMKRLHEKVNIIPLIAKADTLTPDECREFKKTVSQAHFSRGVVKHSWTVVVLLQRKIIDKIDL